MSSTIVLFVFLLHRMHQFDDVEKWVSVLRDFGVTYSGGKPLLCELHFHPDDLSGKTLKRGALPCFFPEETVEM